MFSLMFYIMMGQAEIGGFEYVYSSREQCMAAQERIVYVSTGGLQLELECSRTNNQDSHLTKPFDKYQMIMTLDGPRGMDKAFTTDYPDQVSCERKLREVGKFYQDMYPGSKSLGVCLPGVTK